VDTLDTRAEAADTKLALAEARIVPALVLAAGRLAGLAAGRLAGLVPLRPPERFARHPLLAR